MRIRSHQNPFAVTKKYNPLNLNDLFDKPDNPVILEIGFAGGRFLLDFCGKYPQYNYVALEIKKLLVDKTSELIKRRKLTNARVFHANANTVIADLFTRGQVDKVFIFFPDPWIKKKHLKRNLVNRQLIIDIHHILRPGGQVYIQSDVAELAADVRDRFEKSGIFSNINGSYSWAASLYPDCRTERESLCIEKNIPVYRLLYSKNSL